ncbi:MAG: EutN/CcmL family microcompartment protein [Halothece sp.]
MQMAKVRGTVVGTQKLPSMTGVKLLLLQFLDENGELLPQYEVAADPVGAGLEEWVLVNRGSAARQEEGHHNRPLDAMVVAIIDTVTIDNRRIYGELQ